ncbi:MAG: SigE family RNA polymerase sigma factor [Actinobacteria bacterium HGW-Actinobacteria-5]|jgi:RNA polymerase sigma-70 factor (sigma-E family)|nr:MAG: SigE family RNA polymerase sigma factor [Actinobacteria bacterium HGW-Actinobacteria-5]
MFGRPAPARDAEFAAFVRAATRSLSWTAYLLAGDRDAASDLLQEALLRTYLAWGRVRDGEPTAYARRVLVNLSIDGWRKRTPIPVEQLDGVERRDPQRGVDDRDQLARMLAALPPRQRHVIVLRYLDDLSEADAASYLGISVGAVKSATSRGLAALRTQYSLSEEGERS